jgi:hypothetical protein
MTASPTTSTPLSASRLLSLIGYES